MHLVSVAIDIVLGVIGLGIVILVHEFGHFFAARAAGVEVEAFSIGWGPRIAGFSRGGTEWRISAFPIGGFCKMKGEEAFRKALEDDASELPREKGSYYGVAPWRRMLISFAGPFANVALAFLVFSLSSTIGYDSPTFPNRIVLLSEYDLGGPRLSEYPADKAGLVSGDRIVAADGKPIADFSDLLEKITLSADKPVHLRIDRDGRPYDKTVTPIMDKSTGGGFIGVSYWADPIVGTVASGSAAQIAGIEPGDRLVSIDGKKVQHAIAAFSILNSAKPERAEFGIERGGKIAEFGVVLNWSTQGKSNLGIGFETQTHRVRAASSLEGAVAAGAAETWSTFQATLIGLESLFRGVNPLKAISGPIRLTYMVGQSASEGIQASASGGLAIPLKFVALLSIGLFIMNLLPIPALDGGQIVMFVVEAARKRALRPITIYRYQFIGATFILAIFVMATVGDLLFFAAR